MVSSYWLTDFIFFKDYDYGKERSKLYFFWRTKNKYYCYLLFNENQSTLFCFLILPKKYITK